MKFVASNNPFVYDELAGPGFRLVNCEQVIVSTGEQALEAVRAQRPDLVVLDAELPGVDGYTVCERIKNDPQSHPVRVILTLQGSINARQLQRLAACGCDDVMVFRAPGENLYRHAARLLGLPDPTLGESVELQVTVSDGRSAELSARALHLSSEGVALLVPSPVERGAHVALRLRRRDDDEVVVVKGEVQRSSRDAMTGSSIASVQFVNLNDTQRGKLRDLALWEARALPSGKLIAVRGTFNEETEFAGLLARLSGEVVFDLSGVRMINSWGARQWILFLRALDEKARYSFVNVSQTFIKQCNMVADMLGRGTVLSFAAPYECSACGKDYDRVLQASAISPAIKQEPPEFRCINCGGIERFADLPSRFFAFLRAPA